MKIKIYQVNSDRDVLRVKFMGLQKTQNIQRSNGRSALIDPTLYDEVFSGEVDCLSLEDIYTLFNTDHPPFHRGHSLSISDVVEVLSAPEIVGQIRYQSAPGFYESTNYTDFTCYTNDVHEAEENDRDFEAIDYSDKNIPAVKNGFYYCDSFGFEHTQFHAKQTYKPENLLRVVALEPGKPAYEAEVADHFRAFQQAVAGKFEVTYPFKGNVVAISNRDSENIGMEENRTISGNLYVGPMFIIGDGGDGNFCSLTDEQVQRYLAEFNRPEFTDDEEIDPGIQMQ